MNISRCSALGLLSGTRTFTDSTVDNWSFDASHAPILPSIRHCLLCDNTRNQLCLSPGLREATHVVEFVIRLDLEHLMDSNRPALLMYASSAPLFIR